MVFQTRFRAKIHSNSKLKFINKILVGVLKFKQMSFCFFHLLFLACARHLKRFSCATASFEVRL